MSKASGSPEEIVQFSERVVLPEESANAEERLQYEDRLFISELLYLREHLLLDLGNGPTSRAFRRAYRSVSTLDAKSYFSDIKNLRSLVITPEFRELVVRDPNEAFNRLRRTANYKWLVTSVPVLWDSDDPVGSYRRLIQWVSFETRMNLRSADYSDSLITEYAMDEEEMGRWAYPADVTEKLHKIIVEWMDFYPFTTQCRAMPPTGATLEVCRRENNPVTVLASCVNSEQISEYLRCTFGWEDDPESVLFDPLWVDELKPMKIAFVPKSPLTNRMISIDTASMLMIQKDLDKRLRDWLRELPLKVDLRDQERSRRMALRGSVSGEYGTADLSKASDSVTAALVELLFRDTVLYRPLMLTRNPRAAFKGKDGCTQVFDLNKFAPMGSSTCFPVETLVILACGELAIRNTLGRRGTPNDVRVYGDDGVIRGDCYPAFLDILESIHFTVNREKSFGDLSPLIFREACGMEAVNGVDISPVRISRFQKSIICSCRSTDDWRRYHKSNGVPLSPEDFCRIVSLSNRLELAGFHSTRSAVMDLIPRGRWFYGINRVDHTLYLESSASGLGKQWVACPAPTFVVPDGTGTNYACPISRKTNYDRSSKFQPHGRRVLTVEVKTGSRETAQQYLDSHYGTKDADELAYHYWSLSREAQPVAKPCEVESVDLVKGLRYFGRPDLLASEDLDKDPSASALTWRWKDILPS